MFVLAIIGFFSTTTMAMADTTVQSAAPDELRGRIMSVYTTVFTGTAPFGALDFLLDRESLRDSQFDRCWR